MTLFTQNYPILRNAEKVAVNQEERKKREEKDTRNLWLAREGMIREGTQVTGPVD